MSFQAQCSKVIIPFFLFATAIRVFRVINRISTANCKNSPESAKTGLKTVIGLLFSAGWISFRIIVPMKGTFPKIMLHVLFWIGIWFFFYYFFSYNSSDKGYVVWFSSLLLPLTMAVTYFSVYYLIPRHLFPKEYGKFALYGFYTLVASSYFIVVIIYGCMFLYQGFNATNIPPMVKNFFFILILVYLVVGLVSFITILNRSFRTEKKNRELQT